MSKQRAGGAPQHEAAQEADRWLQPHPRAGEGKQQSRRRGDGPPWQEGPALCEV